MTGVTPDPVDEAPVTFAAFAVMIGKSRPYVSQKVADGTIGPPALTDQRLIVPSLAKAQLADAAVRPKAAIPAPGHASSGTLNAERLRLTTAQAERTEMENTVRRGELIARSAIAAALPPIARRYVDLVGQLIRDTVTDDVERAALIDRVATETETFISKALAHGGPAPPD